MDLTLRRRKQPPDALVLDAVNGEPTSAESPDGHYTYTYTSLPATPEAVPSTPVLSNGKVTFSNAAEGSRSQTSDSQVPPFSIWEYLREELLAADFDSHQELKWERVGNFISMPLAIEKVRLSKYYVRLKCLTFAQIMAFGFVLCFDSFLYTFTILPIRFVLASGKLLVNLVSPSAPPLPPSQKADIIRALLLVISIVLLSPLTDGSKIYHSIRGQDTIKLYVIFNALEVSYSPL